MNRESSQDRHEISATAQASEDARLQIRAEVHGFSGPLPPPEILERYNEIVPGAAERILVMTEKQQSHRQALEKVVITSNIEAQKRGPMLGFVLAMVWYWVECGSSTKERVSRGLSL